MNVNVFLGRRSRAAGLALLFLIWLPSRAAEIHSYLPLRPDEVGPRFALKQIVEIHSLGMSPIDVRIGPKGAQLLTLGNDEEAVLVARGQDESGKQWRVSLARLAGCMFMLEGVRVFSADLNADGISDAVVVYPTCGVGWAPPVHFVSVLFDDQGRPVPFEAEGFFESGATYVGALRDMERNKKPEFIFMNHSEGYWVTNVYQVLGSRWRRIAGAFGERSYPLFTRFTNRPNRKATAPAPGRNPSAPDLSNDVAVYSGRLLGWQWPAEGPARGDEPRAHDMKMTLVEHNNQAIMCEPVYWCDSARLVVDRPEGREIVHLYDIGRAEPLLSEVRDGNYSVEVFGNRRLGECSPELVWATQPPAPNNGMQPGAASLPPLTRGR